MQTLFVAGMLCFVPTVVFGQAGDADVLLRNGTVIDGSGSQRRSADVAITGSRIAAVGESLNVQATWIIDCSGLIHLSWIH